MLRVIDFRIDQSQIIISPFSLHRFLRVSSPSHSRSTCRSAKSKDHPRQHETVYKTVRTRSICRTTNVNHGNVNVKLCKSHLISFRRSKNNSKVQTTEYFSFFESLFTLYLFVKSSRSTFFLTQNYARNGANGTVLVVETKKFTIRERRDIGREFQ